MIRLWLTCLMVLVCLNAEALTAGAAKVDITPPLGTPLNGYGYRMGRGATVIHDPVWARCLYLETATTKLYLITTDLCVINRELRERVLELASAAVPPENIILTATHNHSAQGGMSRSIPARFVSGRFVPEVLEQTARKIAESMRQAYAKRRRGTIGYATGEHRNLSQNRRHPMGPIDPQVGVIRVDDSDGNPIAIISNFAAHPTTVGEEFGLAVSADFPGYYYATLEDLAGPGCVAMFMNGAEGNQECANPEDESGWARTKTIGRRLAIETKFIADGIMCSEAEIRVRYAEPHLPRSIASDTLPQSTVLQTLEINDLLVTFFPGEPCVEIGLEMRRKALELGYRAHFSVGLSNDHLMYFVPPEFFGHPHYEAGMNFYGPDIAGWFYDNFSALLTQETALPGDTIAKSVSAKPLAGGTHVLVQGSAYEMGYQRGVHYRLQTAEAYERYVIAPIEDRSLIPDTGLWTLSPRFIDQKPLALPRMAMGARILTAGLSTSSMDEVRGMADGTGLSFDAFWLLQSSPGYVTADQREGLYRAPFCTMFAVTGDRTDSGNILVGRVLDWDVEEEPTVVEYRPDSGFAYAQVGFPWNVGVFTGMNEAGLVVCAERAEGLGNPSFDAPPLEFVLRDVLVEEDDIDGAVRRIQSLYQLRGYHVLLADSSGNQSIVLELGAGLSARRPWNGLLLGTQPDSSAVDDDTRSRYRRVRQLFSTEDRVTTEMVKNVLADEVGSPEGRARILNGSTQHCVVFDPKERVLHIAFPNEDGTLGRFESLTLRGGKT